MSDRSTLVNIITPGGLAFVYIKFETERERTGYPAGMPKI